MNEPRPKNTHELKTWPEFFDATRCGQKKFELRRNDRDFRVGDKLLLQEWDPAFHHKYPMCETLAAHYTGREILVRVDYIIKVEDFVICGAITDIKAADYVIMSISHVN